MGELAAVIVRAETALPRVILPIHRAPYILNLVPHQVVSVLAWMSDMGHHRGRARRLPRTHLVGLLVLGILLRELPAELLDHLLVLAAFFLDVLALHLLDDLTLDLFDILRQQVPSGLLPPRRVLGQPAEDDALPLLRLRLEELRVHFLLFLEKIITLLFYN